MADLYVEEEMEDEFGDDFYFAVSPTSDDLTMVP